MPTRALAVRALADRAEPVVVDGLIDRLEAENPTRTAGVQYADCSPASTRSPGPGSTGDTGRPRRQTRWPGSGPRRSPSARPRAGRPRRRRPTGRAAADAPGEGRDPAPDATSPFASPAGARRRGGPHRGVGRAPRRRAARLACRDRCRPHAEQAHRLAALALWPGGDEGPAQAALAELAGGLEDGPVLAAALGRITKRSLPAAAPLVSGKLGSPDPDVRGAAVAVAGRSAWPTRGSVAGRAAHGPGPGRAPGGRRGRGDAGPEGGGGPAPRARPRPRPGRAACAGLDSLRRLREPRAVPLAVRALADGEAQSPHWSASPSWAGPPRARRWPTSRSGAPRRESSRSRSAS